MIKLILSEFLPISISQKMVCALELPLKWVRGGSGRGDPPIFFWSPQSADPANPSDLKPTEFHIFSIGFLSLETSANASCACTGQLYNLKSEFTFNLFGTSIGDDQIVE